jgi:hypothetical protein
MTEPLAVLMLPGKLEGFTLKAHARDLLAIPRVVALEPSRVRTPRFTRDATSARQARRLRFPGTPRVLVLYHPTQYPLARALRSRYEDAELWYVPPDLDGLRATGRADRDLGAFDELARERSEGTLEVLPGAEVADGPLRLRLRELEVISPLAFVPDRRFRGRKGFAPR